MSSPTAGMKQRLASPFGGGSEPVSVYLTAVALAAIVGLASGADPRLVVAGIAGLIVMVAMLLDVTIGLMLFVASAFFPPVGGIPAAEKIIGILLVLGWLAVLALGRSDDRSSVDLLSTNTALVSVLCLLLGWVLVSSIWAENAGVAEATFIRYALNFVLFPIVFVAISTPRHIVLLYSVFVTAALLDAALGLQSSAGLAAGGDGRLSGSALNPNELGALLVVAAILAGTLACCRALSGAARALAVLSSGLCGVFVIMTGSRGASVGLIAALLMTPFLAGRGRRLGAAVVVVTGGAAMVVWLTLVAPNSLLQRLTHASGGSGRVDLWTIGRRMFDAHPLLGVGAGNFPVSSIHYLLEPGRITRDKYIIDIPKVTHNIYLQVVAELGLVGILLFGAMIILCLSSGLRAAHEFRRRHDTNSELLVRGLLIALIGLLVADFFSSALYSKQLYVLLAAAPACLAMARRQSRSAQ